MKGSIVQHSNVDVWCARLGYCELCGRGLGRLLAARAEVKHPAARATVAWAAERSVLVGEDEWPRAQLLRDAELAARVDPASSKEDLRAADTGAARTDVGVSVVNIKITFAEALLADGYRTAMIGK